MLCNPALSALVALMAQLPVFASPTPSDQHRKRRQGEGDGLTREMVELLEKFAPVIYLSKEEEYFPSSVDYMLPHYELLNKTDFPALPPNETLTKSTLTHLPSSGRATFLSVNESHNPQPSLDDPSSHFLYGPPGVVDRTAGGRGTVGETVYAFHVEKEEGVVDLFYYTFYPFNYGKDVGRLGVLGNHVGDWENVRVRTVNGTGHSVDYVTHDPSWSFSAGTVRWIDVPKVSGRPVGYSAAGSHGLWRTAGDHVYAHALNFFKLIDVTDDLGPIWDTQTNLTPIQYWQDPGKRFVKRKHKGELGWLNYLGHWGNRGEEDCFWHRVNLPCQTVDAPPGPNRDFRGPPTCVIAPIPNPPTTAFSSYTFTLDLSAAAYAHEQGLTEVQVEQICRSENDKDGEGEGGELWKERIDGGYSAKRGQKVLGMKMEESGMEDGAGAFALKGSAKLKGLFDRTYTVYTAPCPSYRGSIQSYRLSLCDDDGKCHSQSGARKICTYLEGEKGYRMSGTADLRDTDAWRWRY